MSFYSSSITTRLIDPIFNQANTRCEFRLPSDTVVLSNMRLFNVGVTSALLGTARYNHLVGSAGCITAIRLLDGNQVLDSINDVNRWIAFKNYTKNNTVCSNLNNTLSQNALGYVYDLPNIAVVTGEDLYDADSQFSKIVPFKTSGGIRHLEEDTSSAWLSLRDLFPLLGAVVNLNTAVFKNLRVVIEWSKNLSDYAVDLNVEEGLTHKFTTLQPLLCVDELSEDTPMKKSIMAKFEPISYVTLETDRVQAQAVPPTERKTQTFQLQGFNNKKVNRVCVQKVRQRDSAFNSDLFTNMGSPAMIEESHQWRINGSNLYPYAISSANEHLALQNDVWGVSCQPLGGCPYLGVDKVLPDADETVIEQHFPDADAVLGETSYICGNFHGEMIKELQLTYSRLGLVDGDRYNSAVTLLIFAEVQRVIVPSKMGGYVVSYL
jgi:hypothetical protein